jgi:hypothetical protein
VVASDSGHKCVLFVTPTLWILYAYVNREGREEPLFTVLEGGNCWGNVFERAMVQKVMCIWRKHVECWFCGLAIGFTKLKGEPTLGYH